MGGPSLGDLQSVLREKERLSSEWRSTQAKLLRLDRQREFLEKRAGELIRRGLKTMDELDEAEEKEKQEQERATALAEQAAKDAEAFPIAFDEAGLAGYDLSLLSLAA